MKNVQSIGAVNTLIRRPADGKLVGYNTDYIGAISAIEDGIKGFILVLFITIGLLNIESSFFSLWSNNS